MLLTALTCEYDLRPSGHVWCACREDIKNNEAQLAQPDQSSFRPVQQRVPVAVFQFGRGLAVNQTGRQNTGMAPSHYKLGLPCVHVNTAKSQ